MKQKRVPALVRALFGLPFAIVFKGRKMRKTDLKLTLVTANLAFPSSQYLQLVKDCIEGGVTAVQLRQKTLKGLELFDFAKSLQHLCTEYAIPLIVNDNLALCLALNASGLHLGQTDGDVLEARRKLGNEKLLGLTVDSLEQLHQANSLPIDYVGIGAIFPTKNKPDVQTIWGLDNLREACAISKFPVIAIGGITEQNIEMVINAGAYGVAAIGAFHDAADPKTTTHILKQIVNRG